MSRYEFIEAEKAHYPVTELCEALDVGRSGYYAWRDREPSPRGRENERLRAEIRSVHREHHGRYGAPRIHRELVERGREVGLNRVARLMKETGIQGRGRKKFRLTTDSGHRLPVAPNLLERDFEAAAPDQVWVGDITYVWTMEGWAYLAVLLDLYSRRVVGWALGKSLSRELALGALRRARTTRTPPLGLVHHTDRGSQYASADYRRALRVMGATQSMSRAGDCWDNAVAESFFATIKKELIHGVAFATRTEAYDAIADYIDNYYNAIRRHSANGFISPNRFESMATQDAA